MIVLEQSSRWLERCRPTNLQLAVIIPFHNMVFDIMGPIVVQLRLVNRSVI